LTRYRCQVTNSQEKYLLRAYRLYSFANEFDAKPGTAHHQLATVAERLNYGDLDVIYHLYMAVVGQDSTVRTRQNLIAAFKKILCSPVDTSMDTMVAWFIRLHANLYLGNFVPAEASAKYAELENEVLNRVEQAIQRPGPHTLTTLLTMVTTNIAAWDDVDKYLAQQSGKRACKRERERERECVCVCLCVQQLTTKMCQIRHPPAPCFSRPPYCD
jgi:hypothetical protein